MRIDVDEMIGTLRAQIANYDTALAVEEVGTIVSDILYLAALDGIAHDGAHFFDGQRRVVIGDLSSQSADHFVYVNTHGSRFLFS